MKNLKVIIYPILIISLFLSTYFGYRCFIYTKANENSMKMIAKRLDINSKAQQKIDELKSAITFGLIKNKREKELKELQKNQMITQQSAKTFFYYFGITLLVIILLSFLISPRFGVLTLSSAALISLIYGLIMPVLIVTVHKNIEYIGDIILSFDSKGILDSIIKLFSQGEIVIAAIILIFSVIIPLAKSLTLIFSTLFISSKKAHKLIKFFKYLGKWSMIDVFVVSIFLVYLANNNGITDAKIEYGLYFFLIYITLSVIAAMRISSYVSLNKQT